MHRDGGKEGVDEPQPWRGEHSDCSGGCEHFTLMAVGFDGLLQRGGAASSHTFVLRGKMIGEIKRSILCTALLLSTK